MQRTSKRTQKKPKSTNTNQANSNTHKHKTTNDWKNQSRVDVE